MKKKFLHAVFLLLIAFLLVPNTVSASDTDFASTYFPTGKISTPKAAYLRYNGISENGDLINMWYNIPDELLSIGKYYTKWYNNNNESAEFVDCFGIEAYIPFLQIDAKIDDNNWQYTPDWDSIDWSGLDHPNHYSFKTYDSINTDTNKVYEENDISWLVYYEPEFKSFISPIITTSTNEYNETIYHYDLENHSLTLRYRLGVKYIDEPDTEFKVIFSDWSPETSIGKNATQQVLVKPTSLEAPVLSDFSFSVTQENELNLTCGKYYIDVPTSIFDALLYCEASENMFEPMYIETQMKINNNEWEDVYIANPNWIFSNYRIASPDGTTLNENDSVKVRARFVCENLGLYSDWSNIIGTKASFKASTWAQYELLDARILGLIPDKLLNEDLTLPINRAEFADISVKTYEILSGTTVEPAENNPFTDTNDAEILKAYNAGITVGTSATTFSPDKLINREQAATMLARVYKKIAINGWEINKDSDFEDLFVNLYTMPSLFSDDDKISDWAKSSVYFMAANKIINGIGSNTFAPKATTEEELRSGYAQATREQAIIMASKMIKNLNFSTSLLEKTTL